jgi:vancomycin permeability regulator SanA
MLAILPGRPHPPFLAGIGRFFNPFDPMSFRVSNKSHKPDTTDVIIVLGAAIWAGGVPSPALRRRVMHAVALFHQGVSDVMIVSGGIGKNPPSEARIMRRLALEHGISKDKIVMEESAQSTLDSAMACSQILQKNSWSRAVLVTDCYHITRAAILFRLFGINVTCSTPDFGGFGPQRWQWWAWHFREFMALLWNLLRFFRRRPLKRF